MQANLLVDVQDAHINLVHVSCLDSEFVLIAHSLDWLSNVDHAMMLARDR